MMEMFKDPGRGERKPAIRTLDQQAEQLAIELEWAYVQGGLPPMIRVMAKIIKQLRQIGPHLD